jgi:20S proteasome subunit alpha 7
LEKLNLEELDVLEAVKEAARIIYSAHDDTKDKLFELEMSWISPQSMFRHELLPKSLLAEAIAYAKNHLSDMQD